MCDSEGAPEGVSGALVMLDRAARGGADLPAHPACYGHIRVAGMVG